MKDIIYIEDLRVKTIIGIFDWERETKQEVSICLLYTSPSPRDRTRTRMPSSA